MKKDMKWFKKKIDDIECNTPILWSHNSIWMLNRIHELYDQLDEPEQPKITLQDVTDKLWELPLNNRKLWLARLNDEFQEGYIVPLGLKTTDGEEQYLTYNGSYFASRRNRRLQQTFATLEEIPEFYRDLAERVL